jgi:hypothetical protein
MGHCEMDQILFVYFQVIKRELKIRPVYECRYDDRPKGKGFGSTRLERFASVMGEYVI